MELYQIEDRISEVVDDIEKCCRLIYADALGLDNRCGMILVGEDFLACRQSNARRLDYYGGFEYVDSEQITYVGSLKIYSAESARVASHMEKLNAGTGNNPDSDDTDL